MSSDGFEYVVTLKSQGGDGDPVDVLRMVKTVSSVTGKTSVAQTTIKTGLLALLESRSPRRQDTPQGELDRTVYIMTFNKFTGGAVQNGDIIVHDTIRHLARDVRWDMQGRYFTCRLETEAK